MSKNFHSGSLGCDCEDDGDVREDEVGDRFNGASSLLVFAWRHVVVVDRAARFLPTVVDVLIDVD